MPSHVVTQLLLKKSEVEAQIESLNARLAEARTDLSHVVGAVRLFDPAAVTGPAGAYHAATKALKRSDLHALCRAALEASPEPLDTRELAYHVVTASGWDADDHRLRLAVSHKVGLAMARLHRRGGIDKAGERGRATLWRLKAEG